MKNTLIYIIASVLLFGSGFFLGRCTANKGDRITSDTVTIIKYDTIKVDSPTPDKTEVIGSVTVPKYIYRDKLIHDTVVKYINHPTQRMDSLSFPIVRQTYKDSTYYAIVEGAKVGSISPELKYIEVYQKTITNTVTNTVVKKHKFGIGLQAGYGVNFGKTTTAAPYIGIGISYNILTF